MRLLALFLLLFSFALPALADDAKPYVGQSSDRSLEATDKARKVLLADRSKMRTWTVDQWQSWAEERFGVNTSADGSTWQDWRKARIKNAADHSVLPELEELNKPALQWDANDWQMFADAIDTDYRSSDKYFSVILPNGQDRGKFLLGRWAYAMFENNLPERQSWESASSGGGSESGGITSEDVELLLKFGQAQLELLCFLGGLVTASIIAMTWKW